MNGFTKYAVLADAAEKAGNPDAFFAAVREIDRHIDQLAADLGGYKSFSVEIPGKPRPWKRPNYVPMVNKDGKAWNKILTDTEQRDLKKHYRLRLQPAMVVAGAQKATGRTPVLIRVVAYFQVPLKPLPHQIPGNWMTQTPDEDNVSKLIKDAWNGTLYDDDRQVAKCVVEKVWAKRGESRTKIYISIGPVIG